MKGGVYRMLTIIVVIDFTMIVFLGRGPESPVVL